MNTHLDKMATPACGLLAYLEELKGGELCSTVGKAVLTMLIAFADETRFGLSIVGAAYADNGGDVKSFCHYLILMAHKARCGDLSHYTFVISDSALRAWKWHALFPVYYNSFCTQLFGQPVGFPAIVPHLSPSHYFATRDMFLLAYGNPDICFDERFSADATSPPSKRLRQEDPRVTFVHNRRQFSTFFSNVSAAGAMHTYVAATLMRAPESVVLKFGDALIEPSVPFSFPPNQSSINVRVELLPVANPPSPIASAVDVGLAPAK